MVSSSVVGVTLPVLPFLMQSAESSVYVILELCTMDGLTNRRSYSTLSYCGARPATLPLISHGSCSSATSTLSPSNLGTSVANAAFACWGLQGLDFLLHSCEETSLTATHSIFTLPGILSTSTGTDYTWARSHLKGLTLRSHKFFPFGFC